MSVPEPPPQPKGVIVPDALVEFLHKENAPEKLVKLIQDRDAFGRKKYGQPLMSEDGRNGVEDARQELGISFNTRSKAIWLAMKSLARLFRRK